MAEVSDRAEELLKKLVALDRVVNGEGDTLLPEGEADRLFDKLEDLEVEYFVLTGKDWWEVAALSFAADVLK